MRTEVPPAVLQRPAGTLNAVVVPPDVVLFLREDSWALKKYGSDTKAELQLGVWEMEQVLLAMLIVRMARSDATTFDYHIDLGSAPGVRLMQCLAYQHQVDLHLVTNQVVRSWRIPNQSRAQAASLVDAVRNRAWDSSQYHAALARLNQLYPTAHSLWWQCGKQQTALK